MSNIVRIMAEAGNEPCKVDVDVLHDTLLKLPAEKYLELYRMMQVEMGDRELKVIDMDCPIHVDYEAIRKAVQAECGKNLFQV